MFISFSHFFPPPRLFGHHVYSVEESKCILSAWVWKVQLGNLLKNFPDNPEEGLIAIMVGSNRRVEGGRSAVSVLQNASVNQLIAGFNSKLRANNLEIVKTQKGRKSVLCVRDILTKL